MAANPTVLEGLTDAQKEELREIEKRLHRVIVERRAGNRALRTDRHYERTIGSLTFRYETVRCGKENCTKCPHGPYWYVYWKENGRTRSRYVGRSLPTRAKRVYEAKQQAKVG